MISQLQQAICKFHGRIEGRNWDAITGVLALVVLVFLREKPLSPGTYLVLNLTGFGLVLNVAVVSILSLPTSIQIFTEDNIWITRAPYIWLLPSSCNLLLPYISYLSANCG